jgi:TRAP transporter TAXI family solute receptor
MLLGVVRSRRAALALALAAVGGAVAGCQSQFGDLRLTIATGTTDGVYYPLGVKLAGIWAGQMGIPTPKVLQTDGSLQNIALLHDGQADVGIGDVDAVPSPDPGPRKLEALARIYDDYIQIVVRADAPIYTLADLTGHRVSIGPTDSQVRLVADRILAAAGVHGMTSVDLDLNDSITALHAGRIDAFFWSGGLATMSITTLSRKMDIRLLDLGADPSGVLHAMITKSVYSPAVVPAGTYGPHNPPVTTITVPNFLLATDRMSDDVAQALVSGLFSSTNVLVGVNPHAALGIDMHEAIYTEPVPLHPGAVAYYRNAKI